MIPWGMEVVVSINVNMCVCKEISTKKTKMPKAF